MKTTRIVELDALRGIAALAVVLHHFTMGRSETDLNFKIGFMGVETFFIISGFVILLTIERSGNWKNFLANRISRLYPAYWVCVTITTIFIILNNYQFHDAIQNQQLVNNIFVKYIANMTMLQYYFKPEFGLSG